MGPSGIYCLVLWIPRPHHLGISRLPECRVGPGWYVYTGSAKRSCPHKQTMVGTPMGARWAGFDRIALYAYSEDGTTKGFPAPKETR